MKHLFELYGLDTFSGTADFKTTVEVLQQITGAIFIYHEWYILSYAEFPCFPFAVYQRAPKFSISAHFFKGERYICREKKKPSGLSWRKS